MTKKLLFSSKSLRNMRAKKSFAAITFRRFFSSFIVAISSRETCGEIIGWWRCGVVAFSQHHQDGEKFEKLKKFKAPNLIRDSSLAPVIRWKLLEPLVGGPGLRDLPPDELFGWAVLLDPRRPGPPGTGLAGPSKKHRQIFTLQQTCEKDV